MIARNTRQLRDRLQHVDTSPGAVSSHRLDNGVVDTVPVCCREIPGTARKLWLQLSTILPRFPRRTQVICLDDRWGRPELMSDLRQ